MIIEHVFPDDEGGEPVRVWALTGHLDAQTIVGREVGQHVKKGDVIGRFGPWSENGGECC
jgi:hypothetical protein